LHTSHPTHKLRPKCFGPFVITEKLSSVSYCLVLPSVWRIHNAFHATVLSPYQETAVHGPNYPTPAPDLIDGELEWEIDTILASRHHGRKQELQYLIKWVGYPESDNSWELADQVHAPKLKREFHNRRPEAAKSIKWGPLPTSRVGSMRPSPSLYSHTSYSSCRKKRVRPPTMTSPT